MKTKDLFQRLPRDARLLLVRLRSMGDCLLLTGPVRAIKEEFPGFRISVLVESSFAGCFDGNPDFDEVIGIGTKFSVSSFLGRRFHAVINLHGGPTSFLYSYLVWGPRIGAEQYPHARFYQGLVPRPDSSAHTVESTMSLFRWLGVRRNDGPPLRYEFHPNEAGRHEQSPGRPEVCGVASGLAAPDETMGCRTVCFSGGGDSAPRPGDRTDLRARRRSVRWADCEGDSGKHNAAGSDHPGAGGIGSGAELFIGNDSGPMHLAAAVGVPTLAVWGSSDSRRWRPWQVKHRVVQNPFECNPCPGYRCLVAESPLCIESVTIEQVNAAVEELLAEPQSR